MDIITKEIDALEIIEAEKFSVIYNKETKTLSIIPKEKINLDWRLIGDMQISLDSLSIVTENEICLDSLKGKLYLNSKMSKQIRYLQETEEWRKQNLLKLENDELVDESLEIPMCSCHEIDEK